MNRKKVEQERQKTLKKLFANGYDNDNKILEMKIENLITQTEFSKAEILICIGIKEAICKKRLVSFLSAADLREEE